jgi:hypothetical protein
VINHLAVSCKHCHVSVGEQCNLGGGRAHPSRLEAAAIALGFSEAEAAEIVRGELITMVKRYRSVHGESSLRSEPDAHNRDSGEAPETNSGEQSAEDVANATSEA